MSIIVRFTLFLFIEFVIVTSVTAQEPPSAESLAAFSSNAKRLHDLTFTTSAYRDATLRLIIPEANHVAQDLHLQESLPITKSNLTSYYIPSPHMAQRLGAIGNVTTANYTYYFSVDNKFSFLTKNRLQQDYPMLRRDYLWPVSKMDTNAAYQLAVKFLSEASMDVQSLNKDCNVHVLANTPEGDKGKHFVPLYWIYWSKPEQEGRGSTASVELFEPTKTIRQLRVEDSKYILRQHLQITNLDYLLSQTNTPPSVDLQKTN